MIYDDDLYKKYSIYLRQKLEQRRLSPSTYTLLLMSANFFQNFKITYQRSQFLREKIDGQFFREEREERINQILKK